MTFGRTTATTALASLTCLYACGGGGNDHAPPPSGSLLGAEAGAGEYDASLPGEGGARGDAESDAASLTAAVRFVGRRDVTDPAGPKFGWSAARIIARFKGTEVKVRLDEQSLFTGPSRWDVLVDGALASTLTPNDGAATYTLVTGLPDAEHVIELYKRTEGKVGVTQFLAFEFPGGQLLSPPAAPIRRIEFLGDSITAGYGNECASASQSFSGATENARLAFSGLVATELGADHHNVSVSGKGVLLNYVRADAVVFDQLFGRTLPEGAADWVFAGFTPDVVWITLGANDWDKQGPTTTPPDATAFKNKYIALASLVRSKYASAHVFCGIAPSLNDDYPRISDATSWMAFSNMKTALAGVVAARNAAGDDRIYIHEFARGTYPDDVTGCDFHANLGAHRKMADEAKAAIKLRTGWL